MKRLRCDWYYGKSGTPDLKKCNRCPNIVSCPAKGLMKYLLRYSEALQYIVDHEWTAKLEPELPQSKWLGEFVYVAREALKGDK